MPALEVGVADWCAAEHGITARHPFADADLASWVVRLPLVEKRHGDLSRWIARRAVLGIVPDRVRLRPDKTDFAPFYRREIPLWLEQVSEHAWSRGSELLEIPVVRRRMNVRTASWHELRALWRCGSLCLWLDRLRDFS